jgi:GT2 family glycosyltransferase
MKQAAIVVVSYNSAGVIGRCLDSCLKHAADEADVIVVDNASSDGTREQVLRRPAVRLIPNSQNRGFAAAVNQGVAAAGSPCALLLNPDAELMSGLGPMLDACGKGAAAVGGNLVGEHGEPQRGFAVRSLPTAAALALEVLGVNRLWPGNPVNRRYRCLGRDPGQPGEVEQPAGAFLMFRKDAWEAVGGFDESFFPLWFEDVDFCRRLRNKGLAVWYDPRALARHRGGHSVHQVQWEFRTLCWYASLLRYASKHFRPAERRAVCLAASVGAVLRSVTGIWTGRSLTPVVVFGKVIRLALRCMADGRVGRVSPPAAAQREAGPGSRVK